VSKIVRLDGTPGEDSSTDQGPAYRCPEADFVAAMTGVCKGCDFLAAANLASQAIAQYRETGKIDKDLLSQLERAIEE